MKRLISLIILYSSFLLLCPSIKAQWDGAQVQRLTYNTSINEVTGLFIDKDDKLILFYKQWKWNPNVQPYRDSIFVKIKVKGEEWSQPEKIGYLPFDLFAYKKYIGYDITAGVTHLFYTSYPYLGCAETLYYANSDVPDWQPFKIDSLNNIQNAEYQSLAVAFDTLGNVHIAWHVDFDSIGAEWYRVMYANNSTGEWVKQQVTPPIFLGGMESGETIFDVQKNGIAHIVYYGGSWGLAYYARNDSLNGNYWHIDTIPKPQRPLYYYGVRTIKVDLNDTVHLITGGCIMVDCVSGTGLQRHFYYFKESEDSIWQGPEVIPDSTFLSLGGIGQLLISNEGVPYVIYGVNPGRVYFTDRKLGFWQEPYLLLDPAYYYASGFSFVLDLQGKGQAAFGGYLPAFIGQDDSLEIFAFGSSGNSVLDTSEDYNTACLSLFQNYPNPFNPITIIRYSLNDPQPIQTTLKLYNILGREVRELVNTRQGNGNYQVNWDGKDNKGKEVASGIYFYQLQADNYTETKKLLLIK
jgi:hypothetical protein